MSLKPTLFNDCSVAALAIVFAFSGCGAGIVLAGTTASKPTLENSSDGEAAVVETQEKEPKSETAESVQDDVEKAVEEKTDEKRQKLVKDAVSAVEMTREALASLDEEKADEALETLAKVTGKLELVIARSPELAFVPVAVTTTIYDVFAEVDSVEQVVEEAENALDEGRVQDARRLLKGLASEIVISTSHMPMATYPDAIKKVAPLIDDGKIEEAKQQLQLALNLLVVTDAVHSLPAMRCNEMLNEAEELAEKSDRDKKENERLDELMKEVRKQVDLGQVLGYFTEDKADSMYEEIESIAEKTGKGKFGKGFFERIKGLFSSIRW